MMKEDEYRGVPKSFDELPDEMYRRISSCYMVLEACGIRRIVGIAQTHNGRSMGRYVPIPWLFNSRNESLVILATVQKSKDYLLSPV